MSHKKDKKKKKSGKGSGITKELTASKELQAIVKEKSISRGNVMKALWKYIKKHDLKSEDDGRIINCDDKLKALFAKAVKEKRTIEMRGNKIKVGKGQIFMTEIAKHLSKHLS